MARQPPSYFSCAKCGYRGISKPEDHECPAERTIAESAAERMDRMRRLREEQTEQLAELDPVIRAAVGTREPFADERVDPGDIPGETQAARLSRDISGIIDRHVSVTYGGDVVQAGLGVYNLHQRCDACRDVFTTPNVRGDRGYFATGVIVARAVRLAWLKHRCKPIGGELANLETADLRELYEQLEVESMRLAERALAVKAVLDARLAGEQG